MKTTDSMNQKPLPNLVLRIPEKLFFAPHEVVIKLGALKVRDKTSIYIRRHERQKGSIFTTGRINQIQFPCISFINILATQALRWTLPYWLTVHRITRPIHLRPAFLTGPSRLLFAILSVSRKTDHLINSTVHWEVPLISVTLRVTTNRQTHKKWKIMTLEGRIAAYFGRQVNTMGPYTKRHGVTHPTRQQSP